MSQQSFVIINDFIGVPVWRMFNVENIIQLAHDNARNFAAEGIDISEVIGSKNQLCAAVREVVSRQIKWSRMKVDPKFYRWDKLAPNVQMRLIKELSTQYPFLDYFEDNFGAITLLQHHINSKASDEVRRRKHEREVRKL